MKIKFWDRVILFFGALLAVVAGIFLIIVGLRFGHSAVVMLAGLVLGVLNVLLGSFLFMLPQRLNYNKHEFVVQQTDNGELRIAVKAIENLVQKCIDVHDEIDVVSMQVNNNRDGVGVDLRISLPSNISIPLAVASLQKQIKQYLAASSGIDVKEVRVSVETSQEEADASAFLMADDNQQADEAAAEKQEKKLPLHQRIFSKGDQQVTVPEPPKTEEAAAESAEESALETAEEIVDAPAAEDAPLAEEMMEETPAAPVEEEQSDKEDSSNE